MKIEDLLKLSPEDLIRAVEKGDISDAEVLTFPLDTAFVDRPVDIAGNFICCIAGSNSGTVASLKFNRVNSTAIEFTQGLTLIRPFGRLFLSSDAQAGETISFLISSYAPLFSVNDNRSNNLQATYLSDILGELQGQTAAGTYGDDVVVTTATKVIASASTTRCNLVQADITNTGNIYIGFTSAVSATKKVASLAPGESIMIDDYRGDIYAIAEVSGEKVSASIW